MDLRFDDTIVRDEILLSAQNLQQHTEMFEARWMPDRIFRAQISEILRAFGLELIHPVITVMPIAAVWSSR
jgi:hypothetical protein